MRTKIMAGLLALPLAVSSQNPMRNRPQFENEKVKITEVVYQAGVPRERYTRPTDQVIVFLDDCRYQRIDSKTGEKTVRERKAGETIWHNQGEDAPVLINLGEKPYRTLVIELKK